MTLDLREELENATSALAPRGDLVGRAQALGQRRLVVRRLRNVLGGATVVALLALGISNVPAQWSRNFGEVQPGGQATSAPTSIEAALGAVSLPDPAPGFPYRLIPDGGPSLATVDGQQYWIRNFSLAVKPETTTTDSSGTVTGVANGPEAVVQVGTFPLPGDAGVDGHPIVERPDVAGTTGVVVRYNARDGSPVAALYFHAGAFTASVMGFGGVTTDQLTALGNALTGMDGFAAATSRSAAMANAVRTAEAHQRCVAALALEPAGTQIQHVSATTVEAVRAHSDEPIAAALAGEPWASLEGGATASWCTLKLSDDTYKIIAATDLGASITFVTSSQPLDDPGASGPPIP